MGAQGWEHRAKEWAALRHCSTTHTDTLDPTVPGPVLGHLQLFISL